MKRKSISKGTRFTVFARDNFTCRYCGRQSDTVVLEVDHLIPIAKGGTNDEINLITSCFDCNRGKGAKRLEQAAPTESDRLRMCQEHSEQMAVARRAARARKAHDRLQQEVVNYWCSITGRESVDMGTIHVITGYVRTHGPDVVFPWIAQAASHPERQRDDRKIGRYVSGIRRSEYPTS